MGPDTLDETSAAPGLTVNRLCTATCGEPQVAVPPAQPASTSAVVTASIPNASPTAG
ncbi:hypothetical protein [Ornithinimicrobium kibberense]|uniref:hypothetical protein n=1 Tax=Ornithinimicrobium kibberense TaxID=282060 RepID=UPI00360CE926